jgi:hypothetical protein
VLIPSALSRAHSAADDFFLGFVATVPGVALENRTLRLHVNGSASAHWEVANSTSHRRGGARVFRI